MPTIRHPETGNVITVSDRRSTFWLAHGWQLDAGEELEERGADDIVAEFHRDVDGVAVEIADPPGPRTPRTSSPTTTKK